MLGYVLVFLTQIVTGIGGIFQKLWQKKTVAAENAPYIFLLFNSISACIIFLIMNKFDITINKVTLIYAALYGLCAIFALLLGFVTMSAMNLMVCSVFSKGTSAAVWLAGILFFKENITLPGIISAVLMTISVLVPLIGLKTGKISKKGILAGIGVIIVGTASTVLLKSYSAEPLKKSDSVMCLYTNIFMLLFLFLRFGVVSNKKEVISDFKLSKKWCFLVPLSTLCINISTMISMYAVKVMPLTLYSVIGNSIGYVVVFIQSKIIFKEHCSKTDMLSFVLSAAAVMITLI